MKRPYLKSQTRAELNFNSAYYHTGVYRSYVSETVTENISLCRQLIQSCHFTPTSRVLDVGCGLGGLVHNFQLHHIPALGTEISAYALAHSLTSASVIQADAFSLPFRDHTFDLVNSNSVIYYYPPPKQLRLVLEMKRVSRRFVYIDTISKGSPNSRQSDNPDPLRRSSYLLTKTAMLSLCRQAGLELVDIVEPSTANPDFHGLFRIQAVPAIDQS